MPPKKKKDKAKEREEAERRAREEEEVRRIQQEKEAEERRKNELILMKNRKKQDNKERKIRVAEFTEIAEIIDEQEKNFQRIARENCKNAKWERYMRCDGTPDPAIQRDINTYINLQSSYNEYDDIEAVMKHTELDLSLIKELEDHIEMGTEYDEELAEKDMIRFQETVINLDNLLQFKLDSCTHLELCNAYKNADAETSNLQLSGKNSKITLSVWGNLGKNLRIKHYEFKEMNFTFEIPKSLALTNCAIRLLYTTYDHYSQRSRSYTVRKKVQETKEEIILEEEEKKEEEEEKEKQEENADKVEERDETQDLIASLQDELKLGEGDENIEEVDESNKTTEKDDDDEEEVPEFPFQLTPENVEFEDFDEPDDTVDLRANRIIGGIYHFNLFHLPPQPNICQKWVITEVTYPPELKVMEYVSDVIETPPEVKKEEAKEENKEESSNKQEEKTEKEGKIEEETKKEEEDKKEKETKKEKEAKKEKEVYVDPKRDEKPPIGVTLKIPSNNLFFENPMPVMWDEERSSWVMKGFSDIKYSEDTTILQFKMHCFGTFALIQDFYINMPFQSWEIRPRGINWAHLTITAAILELEFDIKDDLCCLMLPANPAIAHIQEIWMKPEQLIKELQWSGVNVFPSVDASKYVSIQNKSSILENHIYQQISLVASAMGFSWSRWNGEADYDDVVLQATECLVDEPLQEDLQTYFVNKTHVIKLKLSEFDEEFNVEPVDTVNYHSNFYHMMKKTGSEQARLRIDNSSAEFRACVKKMLDATKVLTYS